MELCSRIRSAVRPGDPQDLAAALRTLAHDAQLRRVLGQEASDSVRSKWSWDQIVAGLERLYRQRAVSQLRAVMNYARAAMETPHKTSCSFQIG
jgi:hypothetical protein